MRCSSRSPPRRSSARAVRGRGSSRASCGARPAHRSRGRANAPSGAGGRAPERPSPTRQGRPSCTYRLIDLFDPAENVFDVEERPDAEARVIVADAADRVNGRTPPDRQLDVVDHLAGVQLEDGNGPRALGGPGDHLSRERPEADGADEAHPQATLACEADGILREAPGKAEGHDDQLGVVEMARLPAHPPRL